MESRIAIYTSIFGGYDDLIENHHPSNINNPNIDFICFTDASIKSDLWEIRKSIPLYNDPTRNARKYKILPHRFLSDYDLSIWVDGNFLIQNDLTTFINTYINGVNMACFDHISCFDKRNCIYEEAKAILFLGNNNGGNYKDNPKIIEKQMTKYLRNQYPVDNGLISSGVLLRNHNDSQVIKTMECWWEELKYGSKRDQLSFNYVAHKNQLNFNYIREDIRDNKYFKLLKHNKHK